MNKITIDLDRVSELVKKADEIFLSVKAEKTIIELIETEEKIKEARNQAEENLEKAALKINKNFKSIQGDDIKIGYRSFGSRFAIDESLLDKIPAELLEKIIKYKLKIKEVERYASEKGMPQGIIERDRPKKITMKIKESK